MMVKLGDVCEKKIETVKTTYTGMRKTLTNVIFVAVVMILPPCSYICSP